MSVSCTSNSLAQSSASQNAESSTWRRFWVFEGLLQNQRLETILICIVVLCFPHSNIACIHMCDECKRSNAPNVCDKLLSISLPHEQVCSQTTKYQVYHYVPSIDMSEQIVSKMWTILQLIHFLLLQIDVIHAWCCDFEKLLSRFYEQIRNIFPHISLRDLPCHWTKKILFLHQVSLKLWSIVFLRLQRKSWIRTYLCSLPQYRH